MTEEDKIELLGYGLDEGREDLLQTARIRVQRPRSFRDPKQSGHETESSQDTGILTQILTKSPPQDHP